MSKGRALLGGGCLPPPRKSIRPPRLEGAGPTLTVAALRAEKARGCKMCELGGGYQVQEDERDECDTSERAGHSLDPVGSKPVCGIVLQRLLSVVSQCVLQV